MARHHYGIGGLVPTSPTENRILKQTAKYTLTVNIWIFQRRSVVQEIQLNSAFPETQE